MAEQSKSVFYGAGNVGEAVTYERETPNLFELIENKQEKEQLKKNKEKEEAIKALSYSPEEFWFPADKQITGLTKDYLDYTSQGYKNGLASDVNFQTEQLKKKSEIEKLSKISLQYKDVLENFSKNKREYEKQGLNINQAMGYFYESIKDENGEFLPISESSTDALDNFDKMPQFWNQTIVGDNFVKELWGEELQTQETKNGYNVKESEKTYSFIKKDGKGKVLYQNNKPIIEVTPELSLRAKNTHAVNILVEDIVAKNLKLNPNYTYEDGLKEFLSSYDKVEKSVEKQENKFALQEQKAKISRANGITEEETIAENFFKQHNQIIQGVVDVVDEDSGFSISSAGTIVENSTNKGVRTLQTIQSHFDKMAIGEEIGLDGKPKPVFGKTVYDPSTNTAYLIPLSKDGTANNNFSIIKLDESSIGKQLDALSKITKLPFVKQGYNVDNPWFDKYGVFIKRSLDLGIVEKGKTTREVSTTKQKNLDVVKSNINQWNLKTSKNIQENIDKIGDEINTIQGDSPYVSNLNENLKDIPKNIKITSGKTGLKLKQDIYNPTSIQVDWDSEMIVILGENENGTKTTTKLPYSKSNIKAITNFSPHISINKSNQTESMTEISDEDLMSQYGL